MNKHHQPYGTWKSPISSALLATSVRLNDVQWSGDTLIWWEQRGAHGTLMAQHGVDAPRELTVGLSVRGRIGYGGGAFTVAGEWVYFTAADGRLYKQSIASGSARPITPAFGIAAAPRVSPDGRWVVYVHSDDGLDGLALVDSDGVEWARRLAYGTDFVMQPAWHPDGTKIAYIAWNQPDMPWDSTQLHLLTLDSEMRVTANTVIAGGEDTSIFQPEFSPDGQYLSYVSDETGWSQLYLYELETGMTTQLTHVAAEHDTPAWLQGMRTYGWQREAMVYLRNTEGIVAPWRYDLASRQHEPLGEHLPYTYYEQITATAEHDRIAVIASASHIPTRVISFTPQAASPHRVHARSSAENVAYDEYSQPEHIAWASSNGDTVYGLYYSPTNARFYDEGLPPLIVDVHSGPTTQRWARYEPETQFFTARGFAVLSVNYRGSTGYGREYRCKLRGNWGDYDVEDAASGAQHLVAQGLADPDRLIIMGSSAGGFTMLQSLVEKPGFYRAGIGKYAVSNQFLQAHDTHKFEQHYSATLLGSLPEAADLYRQRSPLFYADRITDPVILFQGDRDTVVPRVQSDQLIESLRRRGVPHEYHVYPDEGHGFRQPETLAAWTAAALAFLRQHVIYR